MSTENVILRKQVTVNDIIIFLNKDLTLTYNQILKIDSIMGIDYSARLFGIVFSDIRLVFLERHTYDNGNILGNY